MRNSCKHLIVVFLTTENHYLQIKQRERRQAAHRRRLQEIKSGKASKTVDTTDYIPTGDNVRERAKLLRKPTTPPETKLWDQNKENLRNKENLSISASSPSGITKGGSSQMGVHLNRKKGFLPVMKPRKTLQYDDYMNFYQACEIEFEHEESSSSDRKLTIVSSILCENQFDYQSGGEEESDFWG